MFPLPPLHIKLTAKTFSHNVGKTSRKRKEGIIFRWYLHHSIKNRSTRTQVKNRARKGEGSNHPCGFQPLLYHYIMCFGGGTRRGRKHFNFSVFSSAESSARKVPGTEGWRPWRPELDSRVNIMSAQRSSLRRLILPGRENREQTCERLHLRSARQLCWLIVSAALGLSSTIGQLPAAHGLSSSSDRVGLPHPHQPASAVPRRGTGRAARVRSPTALSTHP